MHIHKIHIYYTNNSSIFISWIWTKMCSWPSSNRYRNPCQSSQTKSSFWSSNGSEAKDYQRSHSSTLTSIWTETYTTSTVFKQCSNKTYSKSFNDWRWTLPITGRWRQERMVAATILGHNVGKRLPDAKQDRRLHWSYWTWWKGFPLQHHLLQRQSRMAHFLKRYLPNKYYNAPTSA